MNADPFAVFPRDEAGKLRSGIYCSIRLHLMPDALKLGWIPVPPRESGHGDEYVVLCHWIECPCGREMRAPG